MNTVSQKRRLRKRGKRDMEVIIQLLSQILSFPFGNVNKYRIDHRLSADVNEGDWLSKILFELGFVNAAAESDKVANELAQNQGEDKAEEFSSEKFSKKKQSQPPQAEILPPDIGDGLGRNQAKRDLRSLAEFVKSKANWMVYQNCLYIYLRSYWIKLGIDDGIRRIRDICSEHQDFYEVLTDSDYKKIYHDLLRDPELNVEGELTSPPSIVNFYDGEIDFSANPPCLLKHNPVHYFMSNINVSCQDVLNPPMRGETFERFISHISNGDETIRTQFQELLSIALTREQLKNFYVFLGPSNSGKTQLGRFVEEVLGRDQVETVRGIHDFGDRWTVGSLAGKKLVTCLDLPDKVLPASAVGIIKQLCGDDPVKGEVKYANSFTYYQKPLLLFAGNHPIRLSNAHREDAFWNRMIVIPFSNPVREEDMERNLYQKLLDEAPYIIHEAIVAYQDLATRNFVLTRSDVPQAYRQNGIYGYDSVRDFVQDSLAEQDGDGVSTKELHKAFNAQSGQDMSLTAFSRALAAAVQELFPHAVQVKRVNRAGDRGYKNLGFIPES